MRIGFDAKRAFHNRSGLGNYSRELIRMLSSRFPDHAYLLYNTRPGTVNRLAVAPPLQLRYPDRWYYRRLSSLWRRGPVVRQLVRDGVELYHGLSNELPAGIRRSGIPTVVTMHDLIFLRHPEWYPPVDRRIYAAKAHAAAAEADRIIAISEQTAKDVCHFLGVPREKVRVIYQGCHAAFKKPLSAQFLETVRVKYALPDQFLLSVGTIEERKNLMTTARSLRHHPLPLVVVGRSTAYADQVRDGIRSAGLQERVLFPAIADMEELAAVYRLATVCCYPSLFEGFGLPIVEALYSGLPVITSKGGCFPEAGGPHSFYIDPMDELAMAAHVRALLSVPSLAGEVAEAGRAYARRFDDDLLAEQVMTLYTEIRS